MEWTIRPEVRTGRGEVESLALTTVTRPPVMAAAAEVGLSLAEAKALLAGLQAAMVRRQPAEHVGLGRVCPALVHKSRPVASAQPGTGVGGQLPPPSG